MRDGSLDHWWFDRAIDHASHIGNVVGGRAAAPANDLDPGVDHTFEVCTHNFWSAGVVEFVALELGNTRIRLDDDRCRRGQYFQGQSPGAGIEANTRRQFGRANLNC